MYAKLKPLSPRKITRGGEGGGGEDNGRKMTRTEQLAIEKAAVRSRAVANETLESIDAFEASIHTRSTPNFHQLGGDMPPLYWQHSSGQESYLTSENGEM